MRQITEQQYTGILRIMQSKRIADASTLKLYLELIALPAQPEPSAQKPAAPSAIKAVK